MELHQIKYICTKTSQNRTKNKLIAPKLRRIAHPSGKRKCLLPFYKKTNV